MATGSSALELAEGINEPLTGRKFEYQLLPCSTAELVNYTNRREEQRLLEQRLIYGFYPEIILNPASADRRLSELSDSTSFSQAYPTTEKYVVSPENYLDWLL